VLVTVFVTAGLETIPVQDGVGRSPQVRKVVVPPPCWVDPPSFLLIDI
jgi:hypothetical protein